MKLDYFVVGTNNMNAAIEFYNSLFTGSGICQVLADERMTFWQGEGFTFAVALPFDGADASNGNGTMFGFTVDSSEQVKRLHKKAIDFGGTNEGDPNRRGPRYSAYVRDLDGNKMGFSCQLA